MTPRGTLAYYFVAVVVGCFFMVLGITAIGEGSLRFSTAGLRDFFLLYFLALVYGWFTMVLLGFVLRVAARRLKWTRGIAWVAAGAVLAPAVVWGLYALWAKTFARWALGGPQVAWWMVFGGAIGVAEFASSRPAATAACVFVGAATAFFLHRVHRAFEPGEPGPPADTAS
jgi:hypothetical protein